ncbi:MAG: hypothetical protein U9N59_00125 [Campylobacterota bacterium]|nr:hypothetical protein [Campylobacterota bacterium]
MKKQIMTFSISAAIALGFTGCFGGGNLTTPVKQRTQDVNPKAMMDVKENAHKAFEESISKPKYTSKITTTLGELKSSNQKLYNLIYPIAQEAKRMYKERALPKDITDNGAQWLIADLNSLNVTTANTGKKFNGRFSPFNDLLILNYNDSIDENFAKFLIAHEFAHAIALHVSEEKTEQLAMLEGAEDIANVGLDIAINEAYLLIQSKDKRITDLIDLTVDEVAYNNLFTKKDLANEKKVLEQRKDGFAAQAAITAGQKDQLNLLGIDLKVPLKTKMVLKHLINSGLEVTQALDVLKGGVDFASANVIAITGHSKDQEMEADSIALELNKRLNVDTLSVACNRFAGDKEAGMFDSHPSYKDRRINLGCKE